MFWPRQNILFVADVHLGKAAAFRARSIPLPHGTTGASLARLDFALKETCARHLVVLGDLWHDKLGRSANLIERVGKWTLTHPHVHFSLVTGNHDAKAGLTPSNTGFKEFEVLCFEDFCCVHHPLAFAGKYVLCGHVHPGVSLRLAGASVNLPCFWFGKETGVLPAFGEFTGVAKVVPEPHDRVFVIAENQVIPISSSCRR
jgi:DNA ligase-associated metallophosphoesterase